MQALAAQHSAAMSEVEILLEGAEQGADDQLVCANQDREMLEALKQEHQQLKLQAAEHDAMWRGQDPTFKSGLDRVWHAAASMWHKHHDPVMADIVQQLEALQQQLPLQDCESAEKKIEDIQGKATRLEQEKEGLMSELSTAREEP